MLAERSHTRMHFQDNFAVVSIPARNFLLCVLKIELLLNKDFIQCSRKYSKDARKATDCCQLIALFLFSSEINEILGSYLTLGDVFYKQNVFWRD